MSTIPIQQEKIIHRLPFGKLETFPKGIIRLTVEGDSKKLDKANSMCFRLARLNPNFFYLPKVESLERKKASLSFDYHFDINKDISVQRYTENWKRPNKLSLAVSIELLYFLSECHRQAIHSPTPILPPMPITVFMNDNDESETANWKMLPIPHIETDIGDWAESDTQSWQWLNSDCLLKQPAWDMKYIAGAVFYYFIAGDLFPTCLTRHEKYHRMLTRRIGSPLKLERAIMQSLPSSMEGEGKVFSENILVALSHELDKTNLKEQNNTFQEVLGKLSTLRLASRWEYENRPDTALDILKVMVKMASPEFISWQMVARLKEKLGDEAGAFEAKLFALELNQENALTDLLRFLYKMVKKMEDKKMEDIPLFNRILEQINQNLEKNGEDYHYLQLAHILFKYRQQQTRVNELLNHKFKDNWSEVMKKMILARMYCMNKDYPRVSKMCKEGITLFSYMPQAGGTNGLKALSYFYLIDGIAHFGAAGLLNDMTYLSDGFVQFTKALDFAISIDDTEYLVSAGSWLNLLKEYTQYFPVDQKNIIQIGIDAYIESKRRIGVEIEINPSASPSIPWYPEYFFFSEHN